MKKPTLDRRQFIGLGLTAAASAAVLTAAGCSSSGDAGNDGGEEGGAADGAAEAVNTEVDAAAYDALIATGPVADDSVIATSTWASKIRDAGTLRLGAVQTSALFSLLNEVDGVTRGFDAGLAQLLTRYILGDETKQEITLVTSDTRESVLQNDQVDTVFATYTITEDRSKLISFAGPYYTSRYSILVAIDNEDIKGIEDLAGKNVAAQSGSTGPALVEEYAPEAIVQEFSTDEEARTALEQGRIDAYVFDDSMNKGSIVKNPGKYKTVGDLFGPEDPYGIGLPLDSDGVTFVNDFLQQIEDGGLWAELWLITIGNRTADANVPEPPAINA